MNAYLSFFNKKDTEFKEVREAEILVLKNSEVEGFINALNVYLRKNNISKEKLAKLTDTNVEQLYPLDSNIRELNIEVLNKILEALKIKAVVKIQIEDF